MIIADTKWKILDEEKTNNGVTQSDMYQLYAYGTKYEQCKDMYHKVCVMILCAGNNETFDFATPIGVGLIDSAINLTRHCLVINPNISSLSGVLGAMAPIKSTRSSSLKRPLTSS
jgi:hypothetical protein